MSNSEDEPPSPNLDRNHADSSHHDDEEMEMISDDEVTIFNLLVDDYLSAIEMYSSTTLASVLPKLNDEKRFFKAAFKSQGKSETMFVSKLR